MDLRTGRILERASIVVCGLVPLAGLIFLGWSAATVIFVLWLDAYLSSLRMIPANIHLIDRDVTRDPLDPATSPPNRGLSLYLGIVMWMFLALPVLIAGRFLDMMVAQSRPGGFVAEAYDLIFDAPWSFAILVVSRVFQVKREFALARAAGPSRFSEMIKVLYGLLLCKGVVLFTLTSVSALLAIGGARNLEIFAGATIIGLVAIELYADRWFHLSRPVAVPPAHEELEIIHGFDARK